MADYCELCDLPLSTCVHGMPPPPPPPVKVTPARRTSTPKVRAPRSPAAPRARATASPARQLPRKFTPPEDLSPHIVAVLTEAGGHLDPDDVYEQLEVRLADSLLEGDRQTTPEGELRWRTAARRARQSLIAEGVLTPGPGLWRLASA